MCLIKLPYVIGLLIVAVAKIDVRNLRLAATGNIFVFYYLTIYTEIANKISGIRAV